MENLAPQSRGGQWHDLFIDALSRMGNIARAATAAGVSRKLVYDHRKADQAFADRWDDAMAIACDDLEGEARRRAFDGVDEPVFHRGEVCGTVRKYSDTLLMFLLNGHRPERFRHRVEHSGSLTLADGVAKISGVPVVDETAT